MSFTSDESISITGSQSDVYDAFLGDSQFITAGKLSTTAYTLEITDKDRVSLDLVSGNLEYHSGPPSENEEVCERLFFRLVERIYYCGIRISVVVLGTQITSRKAFLQLYESSANQGQVTIRKVRKFMAVSPHETRIHETIEGQTSWILRGFVGRECRRAHGAQVARYNEMMHD